MRILLVDDEAPILLTLAANLELDGFDVSTAPSGPAALELFRKQPFDLVLSDVRMPGMDGVALFRCIREINPDCPVVLMTGFALEGLVHDAIAEGVFTVLPKPFDIKDVVAALTSAAKGPVVLIVEGDADTGRATVEALRGSTVRALHLTDAEQALVAIRDQTVDVCVVDMNLPGTSATMLMDGIRALDPSIIQIAVAGHDMPALVRQAAARGSFACLRKPVIPQDLVKLIARARGVGRPLRANREDAEGFA